MVTDPLGERSESRHGQFDRVGEIFGGLTFVDPCDDELSKFRHLPVRVYYRTSSANWLYVLAVGLGVTRRACGCWG